MRPLIVLAALAALLPCLLPIAARAVETQALETIQVTATRRMESAFKVPVATNIVNRDDIRSAAPQTVMDALRREAGTFVQQTTPGQGVVILRGLKGSEVLQVVDGFRLNNAIFRNAPSQYVALVDSQMLDRIEVVRGPMSALYGSDAMGGVVQMLSATPSFDTEEWDAEGSVYARYGSADDSSLSRIEGAVGQADLAISGGFTYQDVGLREVGGGEELPYTDYTARAADLKVRAQVAPGHELTLSAQYSEQPSTPRYDELTPGYGQTQPSSAEFFFEPQRRDFVQLRWRAIEPTRFWDEAEAYVGYQDMQDDRRARDFGSVNQDRERNSDATTGLGLQAGKSLPGSHYVTWGADYYVDEIESSRVREDLSSGATSVRAPRFPDGSSMSQFGVFASDDWEFAEGFDLLGALRWSLVRTRLTASGGFDAVTVEDDDFSGNLSLAYEATEQTHLVLNLGRGFRAPNIFDLGTFGDRPGNRFNIPNPDLSSETVTTLDAGVKVSSDRLRGELIGYVSEYEDKITSVLTGETTSSGRLVVQNQNVTSLDLHGVEGSLRATVTDAIEFYATATYTKGEETLDDDEYPADRIPPLFGSVGVSWQAQPDLELEAYVRYADDQDRYSPRDEVDPRIRPNGTPGWATINARADWQVTDRIRTSLSLTNLGDVRYREFGSGLDEPGFGWHASIEVDL